jgi:hypothetical protein
VNKAIPIIIIAVLLVPIGMVFAEQKWNDSDFADYCKNKSDAQKSEKTWGQICYRNYHDMWNDVQSLLDDVADLGDKITDVNNTLNFQHNSIQIYDPNDSSDQNYNIMSHTVYEATDVYIEPYLAYTNVKYMDDTTSRFYDSEVRYGDYDVYLNVKNVKTGTVVVNNLLFCGFFQGNDWEHGDCSFTQQLLPYDRITVYIDYTHYGS